MKKCSRFIAKLSCVVLPCRISLYCRKRSVLATFTLNRLQSSRRKTLAKNAVMIFSGRLNHNCHCELAWALATCRLRHTPLRDWTSVQSWQPQQGVAISLLWRTDFLIFKQPEPQLSLRAVIKSRRGNPLVMENEFLTFRQPENLYLCIK